ncbi:hypothetical protein HDE_04222 [Halotydeus destructor]|nr:hypothetical protein HDE_04222 [Halotydeus destructor]
MVFKVRQLQILLEDILQHVDRVDKVKIKKISVVSLVAVYITIVVSITCRAQLFVSGLEDETAYQAFSHFLGVESLPWYHKVFYLYLDIIHRPLFEQHWIQVSVILYSVYMLAIYFAETSLIVEPHKMADKGYLRKTAAQKMTLMELKWPLESPPELVAASLVCHDIPAVMWPDIAFEARCHRSQQRSPL